MALVLPDAFAVTPKALVKDVCLPKGYRAARPGPGLNAPIAGILTAGNCRIVVSSSRGLTLAVTETKLIILNIADDPSL
ncbi:hypothetical protein [Methylobacterium oxalidis]|uniref:hypothetical protein n=1 Tax=Methylobacterium oxalidis TaxID=944322 RepID=UPI0011BD9EFC|nr:hypothetical protein [Methylobacterium oxalidis]